MTKNLSIKQIFAQANKAMLLFAVIPLLLSILLYSQQLLIYQQTIANIQKADAIALKVDQKVLESMWDLISGQVTVDEFNEENILEELRNDIREIKNNTNTLKEISTLDVSLRTIDTLEDYQNELINNILAKDFMDTNEEIINQVDSVTQLLSDILQDFVRVEIDLASKKNTTLVRSLILLTIVELGVLSTIFFYAKKNRRFLERKVQEPINQLIEMSEQLSSGNLGFRLTL
ncbi:TPA: sensor histidine kinase, partial [Enterococcus faecium]